MRSLKNGVWATSLFYLDMSGAKHTCNAYVPYRCMASQTRQKKHTATTQNTNATTTQHATDTSAHATHIHTYTRSDTQHAVKRHQAKVCASSSVCLSVSLSPLVCVSVCVSVCPSVRRCILLRLRLCLHLCVFLSLSAQTLTDTDRHRQTQTQKDTNTKRCTKLLVHQSSGSQNVCAPMRYVRKH